MDVVGVGPREGKGMVPLRTAFWNELEKGTKIPHGEGKIVG